MEYTLYIFDIAIAILLVHYCSEEIGKWFYYLTLLMAFGIQNIFEKLTKSLYIPALDVYLEVNKADLIYYGIVLISTFVTMLVCQEKKSVKSLLKCAGAPLIVFYLLNSEYQMMWILSLVLIIVLVVALVVQAANLICRSDGKKKLKRKICRYIHKTQNRAIGVLLTASAFCLLISAIDKQLFSEVAVADVEGSELYRSLSDEQVEKINGYDAMTTTEKFNVLKEIVACETQYLGINTDYKIVAEDLPEGTNGWFDRAKILIAIDETMIDNESFETSLHTCLHEVYHLYQYEILNCVDWTGIDSDLKLIREIVQWQQEYENYKSANSAGYNAYSQQALEISAKEFSDETSKVYMDMLSATKH